MAGGDKPAGSGSSVRSNLWLAVTEHDALAQAWYRVRANRGGSGGDGMRIPEFQARLFEHLTQLRAELLGGTYRSGPYRKVTVPKQRPGYRILTIPSLRDRVVHTSLAAALTPIFEPAFEDCSFAYRPDRGVVQAVQRIELWRKKGFETVIEADIVDYFNNVDHGLLSTKVSSLLARLDGAAPVLSLIAQVLQDQGVAMDTPGRGLAQGSPLSPLLANVYLDALDEEIETQGVKMVRFADDFVLLCKSRRKADAALQTCVRILAEHGLSMHQDKTRIVNFDQGFDFIGYLFVRTMALKKSRPDGSDTLQSRKAVKSEITDEGVISLGDEGARFDPGKRVLYLTDPAHRLTVRNRSFSVRRDGDAELIAIPHRRVGRIEVWPGVQFGRDVIDLALASRVEVSLVDALGQTRGGVNANASRHGGLVLAQAEGVFGRAFRLHIARVLVKARIYNQRVQLARLNRRRQSDEVKACLVAMQRHFRRLDQASTVDEALGLEGAATSLYWPALGQVFECSPSAPFRRTRPATDPHNAAINYLTGILERDIRAAILSVDLHPGLAFLHGVRDRHDGLVFDLMEPFRSPLTEELAAYLFSARRLKTDMFEEQAENGMRISDMGRRALIDGYETAVARRVNRPDGQGRLAWRAMMRFQAASLKQALKMREAARFTPYLMSP